MTTATDDAIFSPERRGLTIAVMACVGIIAYNNLAVSAALMSYLAWHSVDMVLLSYEYHDRSSGTDNMLLWMAQTPMVAGRVVFAIALFHGLIAAFGSHRPVYPKRDVL